MKRILCIIFFVSAYSVLLQAADVKDGFLNTVYSASSRLCGPDTEAVNLKEFDVIYTHVALDFDVRDSSLSMDAIRSKYIDRYEFGTEDRGRHVRALINNAHSVGVKVLFCLGGKDKFHSLARGPEVRRKYAALVAMFADNFGFDGVDIDWEGKVDLELHAKLMSEIRRALDKSGNGKRYYLTTALSVVKVYSAELAERLTSSVDWINIMCYDMGADPDSRTATHNAPYNRIRNLVESRWAVFPKDKLLIGLAAYGYYYKDMSLGAVLPEGDCVRNHRSSFQYTDLPGLLDKGWTEVWREKERGAFYVSPDNRDFISVESEAAVMAKYRWIKESGYRGVFWWEFHTDWIPSEIQGVRGRHIVMDIISNKEGRIGNE